MTMKTKKIVGIDPGSRQAGLALFEVQVHPGNPALLTSQLQLIELVTLKFQLTGSFLDRLSVIYQQTKECLEKWSPDELALEALIYVKSPQAIIKLAQARGAMIAAFSNLKVADGCIAEYAPNLVKAATTGFGHMDKLSGQVFLKRILKKDEFVSFDESDAALVALCHIFQRQQSARPLQQSETKSRGRTKGMQGALAHKIMR